MKNILLLLSLTFLTNCLVVSFDRNEIANIEKGALTDFELDMSYEINDLRIDIIRQEEEIECDSSYTTENVAYHPMGFDLGNGLFFDLNENLSFRIDKLLSISEREDYSLKTSYGRHKPFYRYKSNNEICVKRPTLFGNETSFCRELQSDKNKTTLYKGSRPLFSITKTDSASIYTIGRRKNYHRKTVKITADEYIVESRRGKIRGEVILEKKTAIYRNNKYLVKKVNDLIEIYEIGRKRNYLIYSIKIGKHQIFIYNGQYMGYKIELGNNKMTVSSNQQSLYEIERVE